MKNLLSTIILFLTLGFTYSQVTETFDGVTISGGSFNTASGLSFTTTDNFESYETDLQNGGVTLTAPIPHVYLDQNGSYFEFTPTSADKWLSSLSFDLWYSNSNSGSTLACECKSYDSSGNLLEAITKDVIAKEYNFSGTPKKIRCNLTEINSDNAVFFDDITFILVDQASTSENVPFSFNSTNPLGIESTFSNNSTGDYSFSVGIANTASGKHSSALGQEANATGLSSLASGYDTTASGAYSSAFGQSTTASGSHSSAFGNLSTATAFTSFSAGSDSHANGAASIALGSGANAQSDYAVAIGHGATTSAESSVAIGYNVTASAVAASAMGYNTTASGVNSTAMGSSTQSISENSFAGGFSTQSTGYSSAALGRETVASGNHSLSLGQGTNSHAFNSVALGQYNSVSNNADPDTYLTTNTALVIGNGTDTNNRSNAFKVLFDGTTAIAGSVTASSFIGDGSGLTSLPLVVESITEGGNTGVRLSSANAANHGDIGNTAVDLSYQSSASTTTGATGQSSFAVGLDSTASGTSSISGGYASVASGDTSVALGNGAQATGTFSYSIGHLSEANGNNSVAIGNDNEANGSSSTAIGRGNLANGETATATGQFTSASGKFSLSSGLYSNASGTTSVALGNNTIADGYGTLATGYFNTANANPQADSFDQSNTAFVIGNGTFENRSNAFKVLFDGTTTIAGDLSINSDARLKANIISLGATLSKLLKIDGKSYTMKKDESEKQKIGLLAQDIEKVFPELVSESNGVKSVNYQGLVPVLINALKEQDVMMKEQQRILSEQQSELDELKSMMKKIIERQ